MAEKRMFSKKIINSDIFLEMPTSAQALYFHLNFNADDEGFIDNPKMVMRMVGAREDDFKILLAKRYLLSFNSGVVVIKHWKVHNTIRHDRSKETNYLEEKDQLWQKENGIYTFTKMESYTKLPRIGKNRDKNALLVDNSVDNSSEERLPSGCHRIDKNRIEEIRLDYNKFYSDIDILELWKEFLEVRKSKGAINSENSIKRLSEELFKISKGYKLYSMEILAKSCDNGWKAVFPISGYKLPTVDTSCDDHKKDDTPLTSEEIEERKKFFKEFGAIVEGTKVN